MEGRAEQLGHRGERLLGSRPVLNGHSAAERTRRSAAPGRVALQRPGVRLAARPQIGQNYVVGQVRRQPSQISALGTRTRPLRAESATKRGRNQRRNDA